MNVPYREKIVVFGPERSLVGVLTMSVINANTTKSPVVVIPNFGLVHHVGPNRLSVRLAREFAKLGLTTFRFDLSGIGDSAPSLGSISIEESVARDIDRAMSYLQNTYGVDRFIFTGLCSGAHDSFHAAHRDSRVVGAVLLDYRGYKTPGFYLRHYGSRLTRSESWWNALLGKNGYFVNLKQYLKTIYTKRALSERLEESSTELPRFPTRSQFYKGLIKILNCNTQLLFLYTGGWIEQYNYKNQFFDAFPKAANNNSLRVEFFPESDHTFSCEDHRQYLFKIIKDWMKDVGLIDSI